MKIEPENGDVPVLRFCPYSQVPAVDLPGSTPFVFRLKGVFKLATRFIGTVAWSKVSVFREWS